MLRCTTPTVPRGLALWICFLENPARSCWDFPTPHRAHLFVEKTPENCAALVTALRQLGFDLSEAQAAEVARGKDFIQLKNGPFDLDLIAPDGIERFRDAWERRVEVEGFPICHLDDIIASKRAAHRQKDLESLPRLEAFREFLKKRRTSAGF